MMIRDSALISKNTPSVILHLDTIRNGIAHEVLAKSDKYLKKTKTGATFFDFLVYNSS